jgi:hypothetical protein
MLIQLLSVSDVHFVIFDLLVGIFKLFLDEIAVDDLR